MAKIIGVLALQGDFAEHIATLTDLGVVAPEIRLPQQLANLDGLIIPGGESTTMVRLLHDWKLHKPICEKANKGMGIWGTCAGTILLAKHAIMYCMDLNLHANYVVKNLISMMRQSHIAGNITIRKQTAIM